LNQKFGVASENSFEGYKLRDYLDMVLRRWHWIALSAIALTTMAAVFVERMPNVFHTEAVILVDPQKIAIQGSSAPTNNALSDKLGMIKEQVLARTRLKKLITDLDLYRDLRGKLTMETIVDRMTKEITVEIKEQPGLKLNAFSIGYSAKDPLLVARVTNQLASDFIEENMSTQSQYTFGTRDFLASQLESTKKDMDAKADELRELKTKYIGALPESQQYHLEALSNLRAQISASQDRINRDQQQKVYLQSLGAAAAPTVEMDNGGSSYETQLEKLNSDMDTARARYGPKHPEVRKIQAQLDEVKQRIKEQNADGSSKPAIASNNSNHQRNPVIDAQITSLDKEIADQTEKIKAMQPQIETHMGQLQQIPMFDQKISDMMRDYDTLRQHYTDLLNKKLASDTQIAMDMRMQGERFVLLDPAPVPDHPESPKRLLTILAAFFGGLFGGLAAVIGWEFADSTIRNRRDAALIFEQPVLVEVLLLQQPTEKRYSRAKIAIGFAACLVGAASLGFVASVISSRLLL
jgi:polysaccharide chain length determinant protein (PEP-CTERM system associated)